MKRSILLCAFLLPALAPLDASAQLVVVRPAVTFVDAPRLVVVRPGVRVVEDSSDEVFFVGGYYWTRSNGVWFRSVHHRASWVAIEPARVPRVLVKIKPGTYRKYKVHGRHGHKRHKRHRH